MPHHAPETTPHEPCYHLRAATLAVLRADLTPTAEACVRAIVQEVPGYDRWFDEMLRQNIEGAVARALAGFLDALEKPTSASGDGAPNGRGPTAAAVIYEGARRLGQGEARSGRTTDALLRAYRVGARTAWSRFSAAALDAQEDAASVAALAARTFVYIDELSAASLAGHTEALTARTRELERRRDQLAAALAAGEARSALEHLAESARWNPPGTLTALVVDGEPDATLTAKLGEPTLWTPAGSGSTAALLPDLDAKRRGAVLAACGDVRCALGPDVEWSRAAESVRYAQRALRFATPHADCDALLPELLLDAEPVLAQRLAARAIAPLQDISPAKQAVLTETLLTWLLHQGHRDEVAAQLHVHPQTVRYRMNTLREAYGEQLSDERDVLTLTLGLLAERNTRPDTDGGDR